jgi:dsDNA-specific endonuclease/ATPase MutS2
MQSFGVGEKISILDESGIFTIKEIQACKVRIEDEFGFEQWIEKKFLVKRRDISFEIVQVKDDMSNQNTKNVLKINSIPEIDLHIENLIKKHSNLSAHEKFILQMDQFKRFTNQMIQQKVTKFRVIHGAGEGKLKSEISNLIKSKNGITMHDDNFANGKVGASIIELKVTKVNPLH